MLYFYFVVKDTATTEFYTYLHPLSRHVTLPIYPVEPQSDSGPFRRRGRAQNGAYVGSWLLLSRFREARRAPPDHGGGGPAQRQGAPRRDRKSTRLNSSH